MKIPIEDFFEDILGKSMRGLGISDGDLAASAGIDVATLRALVEGTFREEALRKVAPVLGLHPDSLVASARKEWYPRPVDVPGLAVFNTPYHDMRVNAFLLWDRPNRVAVAFDTGTDVSPMLDTLRDENLELAAVMVTHTHGDHIQRLEALRAAAGQPPAFVHELEAMGGAESFTEGAEWSFGGLRIRALHTHGHSAGGTTYVVAGLDRPVAVVGDALFAGSMGGGMVSYADALENNRKKIMTLPDETVICPGHGPPSSVAEEKAHNPFFPEFK